MNKPKATHPDNWAKNSPALETLHLVRHSPDTAHRLPPKSRYTLMGWCRHRRGSLDDSLEWVWQSKEDTPERRICYSKDWRA